MAADNDDKSSGRKQLSDETRERIRREALGVGYGQPPKHAQFQKGQSGNPKGRPRGVAKDLSLADQPTLSAVLKASRQMVSIREGDRINEVPTYEAIVRSINATAAKGNARSQGLSIDLMRTAELAHARDVERRNAFWSDYKQGAMQALTEAEKSGREPPELLPHPDDIEIDPADGPKLLGPMDEDDLLKVNETIAICEMLLMQEALDDRLGGYDENAPAEERSVAPLLFFLLQETFPKRLRMSTIEIVMRQSRYASWPKRKLLKGVFRGWQKLGGKMPRGTTFPNLADMRPRFGFTFAFITEFRSGRLDIDAIAGGKFDENVMEIMERFQAT